MPPASPTPTWTEIRARLAGLFAHGATADDPRVVQARQDLAVARRASELDRAVDDPAALAKAAKIVSAAIARRRLTLDLLPAADGPDETESAT